MSFIEEYAIGQFGKRVVNRLAKKGIKVIGTQMIPDERGEYANATVAYMLDDNGTGKLRSYLEVLALSK